MPKFYPLRRPLVCDVRHCAERTPEQSMSRSGVRLHVEETAVQYPSRCAASEICYRQAPPARRSRLRSKATPCNQVIGRFMNKSLPNHYRITAGEWCSETASRKVSTTALSECYGPMGVGSGLLIWKKHDPRSTNSIKKGETMKPFILALMVLSLMVATGFATSRATQSVTTTCVSQPSQPTPPIKKPGPTPPGPPNPPRFQVADVNMPPPPPLPGPVPPRRPGPNPPQQA